MINWKTVQSQPYLVDSGSEQVLTISFCVSTSKLTSMLSTEADAIGCERALQL